MRRSRTLSLGDAIKEYVDAMHFKEKLNEVNILNSWQEVVGKSISIHTKKIYIRKSILYVHLDSSVVRNELMMLKQPLIQKLNEKVGEETLKDIVFR